MTVEDALVAKKSVEVTEVHSDSDDHAEGEHDHEHEHKHDANCNHDHDVDHDDNYSRGEKKARKALSKLGLKPVPGISRVTMKRSRNVVFAINNPEVFINPVNGSYIVFGEAKVEDLGAAAQATAAENFKAPEPAAAQPTKIAEVAEDDNEEVSAEGVDERDIQVVIEQASCSRSKAIKALKNNNNDIVNAIMELST